ncbi:MAG: long-chain fatty acid--CoA ligase [Xenococcaceae cyanobacterium]
MFWSDKIYRAPPYSGEVILGRTLPSLLDEACVRHPNPQALNQWTKNGWQSLSNQAFRTAAEELALGLLDLELEKGDRVALLMHSDINFCIADMGCLLAGLVNVPIDLTQTLENIIFILQHTEAKALIISDLDLLYQVIPYLWETPDLQTAIVADAPTDWQKTRSQLLTCHPNSYETGETPKTDRKEIPASACLRIPMFLCQARPEQPCPPPPFPQCIELLSLAEVLASGRSRVSADKSQLLRAATAPDELATIIYIAGTMGRPKGVMLTHENISADILAAFTSHPDIETGAQEVALSFLPLTHIFARTFLYGHLNYGHSIYFSTPSRIVKHLKDVQPTIFITVPRLLEKVYSKILEKGHRLTGLEKVAFDWALNLAKRHEVGQLPKVWYALQLKLAEKLVFSKWRAGFGGRLKALISGGAALRADITNIFSAVGIPTLQGYGLTETSAVLCYNRGEFNRAGTVGVPIPGVEMAIADDCEILVRAPYVTQGYYKDPNLTQEAINEDGWFHTGDLGEFTEDGFLKITGVKKSLFKLATGKYVIPQPLEHQLKQSPLVEHAIAVGANRKFCGMLIFPNLDSLHREAQAMGIDLPTESLLMHPCIMALYQALIDETNCHLPYWSTVRRFQLVNAILAVENGMLMPTHQVRRGKVIEAFAKDIDAIYGDDMGRREEEAYKQSLEGQNFSSSCPTVPPFSCPAFAKSLMHH